MLGGLQEGKLFIRKNKIRKKFAWVERLGYFCIAFKPIGV